MSAPGPVRAATVTRDTWETPAELFEKLDQEFAFTIDGAASAENAKCEQFYSDAFNQYPMGQSIFVNPPYGRGLADWLDLFERWRTLGNLVVALLPASTDTEWFEKCYWSAEQIRLLRPRVQFVGTTSSNTGGSIVAIWRKGISPARIIHWRWR